MPAAFRPVLLNVPAVSFEHRADDAVLVTPTGSLGAYPARLTERLEHWARVAPDRVFLAQRPKPAGSDGWRTYTYSQALAAVRAIGAALLARGLSPDRPVAILSGNDIEHALLGLACLHVGVPYSPISTAYATVAKDFAKLRHIIGLLTPGLVYAAELPRYARAIAAVVPAGTEIVTAGDDAGSTPFAALLAMVPDDGLDRAAAAVGPDHVAKILFTSGSTGLPKGVINTQRMLCSNQAMLGWAFPFFAEEPPVIVDWLPWNHTFGGNHNVGLILNNGGTLYIDEGKPIPGGIAETVRNLREIAPTVYFNVPKGYEELAAYLHREPALRALFFSRVKMFFYAGAGLAQHVWDAFDAMAIEATGQRIRWMTGLGSTETGPFALSCHPDHAGSGIVGLPVPGCELKLVPVDGKLEARVRGPSVTPGFWRNAPQTQTAYDEEGFYRMGDALRPLDPDAPYKGFRFDGRIAEDFKLATGTWVSVGPLRAKLIAALAPHVRDVVIAGHDRDFVSVIAVPEGGALDDPKASETVRAKLAALAQEATGSSNRVVRAMWLTGPLSIDAGEVTDKGSINQRALLAHRAEMVAELYAERPPAHVISIEEMAR